MFSNNQKMFLIFDFEIFYSDIKAEMDWTRDKYCPCKVLSRNCVIADYNV